MDESSGYSGYMPMIGQITVSTTTQMLNTEGELMNAHSIILKTRENKEFVFSITTEDLMKLYFLIGKII